jgi:hypothetical protein
MFSLRDMAAFVDCKIVADWREKHPLPAAA